MLYAWMKSPMGELLLAGRGGRLRIVEFAAGCRPARPRPDWMRDDDALGDVKRQLDEYFDGARRTFDLSLEPIGTNFQRRVWDALLDIPYGETRSYGDIAVAIGNPKAAVAVGAANGSNPLPIVIPCHRVVGSDGQLTGYGGGLPAKRYLLDLECESAASDLRP